MWGSIRRRRKERVLVLRSMEANDKEIVMRDCESGCRSWRSPRLSGDDVDENQGPLLVMRASSLLWNGPSADTSLSLVGSSCVTVGI